MPSIPEILLKFKNAQFFSKVDLNAAFYNIMVHPEDREKTAFSCLDRLYKFCRMGMGLSNAPANMSWLAEMIVASMGAVGSTFVDDLTWASVTAEEHLEHTEQALYAVIVNGVKLKAIKCDFANYVLNILGHTVDKYGIHIDLAKTDAIRNLLPPTTQKSRYAHPRFL